MFNSTIRYSRSGRRVLKNLQNTLLIGLLFVSGSVFAQNEVINPFVMPNQARKFQLSNDLEVLLASKALNPQLFRAIVAINTHDNKKSYRRTVLLFKNIDGFRYMYFGNGGTLCLEHHFIDKNNFIDYKRVALGSFPDEIFDSVDLTPCDQKQTRSDDGVASGCTIHAVNIQAELKERFGSRLAWSALFQVYYTKDGETMGHSYCAYRVVNKNAPVGEEEFIRNQTFYAEEKSGKHKVVVNRYDAVTVAKELKNYIVDAHFDE